MSISVIIPARNEEAYIGETLERLAASCRHLAIRSTRSVEVIVVDNQSTDKTAVIAKSYGARIVTAADGSVSSVRNKGARESTGDLLVFLDADTTVPESLLWRIHETTQDPLCVGGAVDTEYLPKRRIVARYLGFWRVAGKLARLAQGALQFCKRDVFVALHGYDTSLFMGEDVDFYHRLRRYARMNGRRVQYLTDVRVRPSTRRFDQWPFWRTLLLTNPLFIVAFRRTPVRWEGWYGNAPR